MYQAHFTNSFVRGVLALLLALLRSTAGLLDAMIVQSLKDTPQESYLKLKDRSKNQTSFCIIFFESMSELFQVSKANQRNQI